MRLLIRAKGHFDAAHYLKGYPGKCQNLHGHRWEVEVTFQYVGPVDKDGYILVNNGMAADFKHIKALLDSVLPDHKCINDDVSDFSKDMNPTAENLAIWICDRLGIELIHSHEDTDPSEYLRNCKLIRVQVWESPECSAIVEAD